MTRAEELIDQLLEVLGESSPLLFELIRVMDKNASISIAGANKRNTKKYSITTRSGTRYVVEGLEAAAELVGLKPKSLNVYLSKGGGSYTYTSASLDGMDLFTIERAADDEVPTDEGVVDEELRGVKKRGKGMY